jgi:hypothetical protein
MRHTISVPYIHVQNWIFILYTAIQTKSKNYSVPYLIWDSNPPAVLLILNRSAKRKDKNTLLSLSIWLLLRLWSNGMWHHVVWYTDTNILGEPADPKCYYLPIKLHSGTSQKTVILTFFVMRISNLTPFYWCLLPINSIFWKTSIS